MITEVLEINAESLQKAREIVLQGGVVGMPTETVYGLGGNAFIDDAVKRIFEVKGRPSDNPLIAHVFPEYDLTNLIDYDPPCAKKLREAFLPGPLTLVYPSTGKVSRFVSCGLDTLAIRVPSHVGAQAFLRAVNVPIVAPSANLSKHVSPTTAKHVYDDFNGKIPLILDGGASQGGIESTVCDLTGDVPVILRPGLITQEMIARVAGDCLVANQTPKEGEKVKSPGVLYKHYSPRCETALFRCDEREKATNAYDFAIKSGKKVGFLCEESVRDCLPKNATVFSLGKNGEEMARSLYARLREAENEVDLLIAIEPKEKDGVMVGVMNRLKKACTSSDVPHGEKH